MNSKSPLVSVICLCYNHERFVRQAVLSVVQQTYPAIQIIIADDASTDGSVAEIRKLMEEYPQIESVLLDTNVGNCKAFNTAFAKAKGEYIIDLSTDDVLAPDRVEKQVQIFQSLSPDYGVVFTDAEYIKSNGDHAYYYYERLKKNRLLTVVPQGDVYREVIARFFIAAPTMMIKKEVLIHLNGYDEQLAYEDFDFWVRSARKYKYAFLNERLTQIRLSENSLSTKWYRKSDRQLGSTYLVCEKIKKMNVTDDENTALVQRLRFELRQSVFSENRREAVLFYDLLAQTQSPGVTDNLLMKLNKLRLPLAGLRELYHRLRYGT